jgi:hypothetical protein
MLRPDITYDNLGYATHTIGKSDELSVDTRRGGGHPCRAEICESENCREHRSGPGYPRAGYVGVRGARHIQTIPETSIGVFVNDQRELLKCLDTIRRRRPKKAELDHIWGSLRKVLTDTVHGDAVWHLTDDGTLSAAAHPRLDGVQACTAFATALLLDRSRGLNRCVQRCELEECRRWFFDWKRTGAPKKFCSNQHAAKCRQIRFSQKRRRRAR